VKYDKETSGAEIAEHIARIYQQLDMKMDIKNIQRRVYDALNVLEALGIICKDNRTHIKYIGEPGLDSLPKPSEVRPTANSKSAQNLLAKRRKIEALTASISQKENAIKEEGEKFKEQVRTQIALKSNIEENFETTQKG